MAEYIDREAALAAADLSDWYSEDDISDGSVLAHEDSIREKIYKIPAADVKPVVYCRDCVYWQKPQVWQNDGAYRDVQPDEWESGVPCDVGAILGSFCTRFDPEDRNHVPLFMSEDDFCSKGVKTTEAANGNQA